MLLTLHIVIALASLIASGLAFLKPSNLRLRASYELITLTIVSGTYLVLHSHVPLARSCLTGLVYLAIVTASISMARRKLAKES